MYLARAKCTPPTSHWKGEVFGRAIIIQNGGSMLTKTQIRAVEMLFVSTDEEITKALRIRQETLEIWKLDPEFSQMVVRRLKENRNAARRILSQICVDSCRELESLIKSDDAKDKPRAIIEVLKASGLFKELSLDDNDDLQDLLGRFADDSENTDSDE
jgi:hypothetical protein